MCQDRVYVQPISFLSPLYTEDDKRKSVDPLVGTDDMPGLALTDEFKDEVIKNSNLAHIPSQSARNQKELSSLLANDKSATD